MTTADQTKKCAVIGWPIAHSRSPEIHRLFAEQFDVKLRYERIAAPTKDDFDTEIRAFFDNGGVGMNVTLPYKYDASLACATVSDAVIKAAAANTLSNDTEVGYIKGDNTDGVGLVKDLTINLKREIRGKKILIVGAGGAASGIIWPILKEEPASICIANRTEVRAAKLARNLENFKYHDDDHIGHDAEINHMQMVDLHYDSKSYDLIIHATSAGMDGEPPDLWGVMCAMDAFAYDLSYGKASDPFVRWAKNGGLRVTDGLGMLVEQAALSFSIWFDGLEPDTAPVIKALRGET